MQSFRTNAKMMSSHFRCSDNTLVRMIFLLFITLFFFLETSAAGGVENPVVELSSRDELVNIAGYGEEKLSTVTISGQVICHACLDAKTQVIPMHPVSGASVAVFCGARGKSRKSGARGMTDEYGSFLIDLPSHLHAIPNLEKVCTVKVLHLPKNSVCRQAFTGKQKGIKLQSIHDGARFYTADDIVIMPKLAGKVARAI